MKNALRKWVDHFPTIPFNDYSKDPDIKVRYKIKWFPKQFWWHWWTPKWHEGRGPYISIGLGFIAFYRGY